MLSYHYTLSGIKSRTVGDGQHGTARWATNKEIRKTYAHVPFKVRDWRKGVSLPTDQGLVLGCKGKKGELTALVDGDDIHCLMIAASGAGKTAFFLYPNLEYACASGMSFLALDTKGDLARNYGSIAKKYYGYKHISVIDLRNPTRSDGNNLLTLINRYMDIARKQPDNLAARAKGGEVCQDPRQVHRQSGGKLRPWAERLLLRCGGGLAVFHDLAACGVSAAG